MNQLTSFYMIPKLALKGLISLPPQISEIKNNGKNSSIKCANHKKLRECQRNE